MKITILILVATIYNVFAIFDDINWGNIHDPAQTQAEKIKFLLQLEKWEQQNSDLSEKLELQEQLANFKIGLNERMGNPLDSVNAKIEAQEVVELLEGLISIEDHDILEQQVNGVKAITSNSEIYGKAEFVDGATPSEGLYRRFADYQLRYDQYQVEREFAVNWINEAGTRLADKMEKMSENDTISTMHASKIDLSAYTAESKVVLLRSKIRRSDMEHAYLMSLTTKDREQYEADIFKDEFKSVLDKEANPNVRTYSNRGGYVFDGSNGDDYVDSANGVVISAEAIDLIIYYEVGGESYYNSRLARPTNPGGASGVTIGIGYDLGYKTHAEFKRDWGDLLSPGDFSLLSTKIGKKGSSASTAGLSGISIPYQNAAQVFANSTLPKWSRNTFSIYPTMTSLHPHSQGALVSLAFNRGHSLKGHRRRHMRYIRESLIEGNPEEVPGHFRDMKVIWAGKGLPGLLKRRDAEADLFELGLTSM